MEIAQRPVENPTTSCSSRPRSALRPAFDLVVLDESQRTKNAAVDAEVVCSIPRKRIGSNGTPVENSADDLLGIFEFLAPGIPRPDMKPRTIGRSIGGTCCVAPRTTFSRSASQLLHDEPLELSPEQRESYRLAEDEARPAHRNGDEATINSVRTRLRLETDCNFRSRRPASAPPKSRESRPTFEEIAQSGPKSDHLQPNGSRALKKLSERLERFGPLEYHGRIPSCKRDPVIQRFRERTEVATLLDELRRRRPSAELQFVNYVFCRSLVDPAVEDQAINRAIASASTAP